MCCINDPIVGSFASLRLSRWLWGSSLWFQSHHCSELLKILAFCCSYRDCEPGLGTSIHGFVMCLAKLFELRSCCTKLLLGETNDFGVACKGCWNLGFHVRAFSAPVVKGSDCLGTRVSLVTSRVYKRSYSRYCVALCLLAFPTKHDYSVV